MGGSESSQSTEKPSEETEISEYRMPWRRTPWGLNESLENTLKDFKLNVPNVNHVRILVIGEVGAGKSSFISSVSSVFQRRITNEALFNSKIGTTTFTKTHKTYYIRSEQSLLPFVLTDTMGLESGDTNGVHQDDIVKVMEGYVKDKYKFNPESPISPEDESYRFTPTLQDQTHCLVWVMAADKKPKVNEDVIEKMEYICNKAAELEIPSVIIMTKVDEICPLVKKNIKKIYNSKMIKDKLKACSERLGIPMSHVYPVKCYHEEIDTEKDIDALILRAVTHIVQMANDTLTVKGEERTCE